MLRALPAPVVRAALRVPVALPAPVVRAALRVAPLPPTLRVLAAPQLLGAQVDGSAVFGGGVHDALRTAVLVVLSLDLTWYAVLLCAELRRPRPHYDVRRWATVFPMGMTAVATLTVATAAQVPWLTRPGRVLLWIALAAWLLTLAGLLRRAARAPRPGPRS
ncbi:hypothetical protein ACQB60_39925 [Actinomycetota bacterium Odt1-20B]